MNKSFACRPKDIQIAHSFIQKGRNIKTEENNEIAFMNVSNDKKEKRKPYDLC